MIEEAATVADIQDDDVKLAYEKELGEIAMLRSLNSKRYQVLWNRVIDIIPNFKSDLPMATDKVYIDMRKMLITYGLNNTTEYNTPNLKLLYWYEEEDAISANASISTYV